MSEKLLGSGPLGQGGDIAAAHTHFAPQGPYYFINDTFTTDRAAGAVNGTNAEPGPGRRFVTDTGSKLSLSGGSASFATGGANGDPRLYYNPVDRRPGLILKGVTRHTSQGANWGVSAAPDALVAEGIRVNAASLSVRANSISLAVGAITTATTYQLALAIRAGGALHFIKGGAFTNWTLIWVSSVATGSALYPAIESIGTSSVLTSDYISIPPARWLPAPLASDGFSSWELSDGLGHAEGVAGGLGTGGHGVTWTQNVGTWAASNGVLAATSLTGGLAIATIDTATADVIACVKTTVSTGSSALIVRFVDNANFVLIRRTATNVQISKIVAGVETSVQDTVVSYVAGAELRVICAGQKFRLYYNNALVGSEQTIADAGLQSGTRQGVRTTDVGNTFDDFVVYARGAGGEYSALDSFSWQFASGAIATANLLEAVENPTTDQVYTGASVTDGQPWTIAIRATWNNDPLEIMVTLNSATVVGDAGGASVRTVFVDGVWYLPTLLSTRDAVYMLVCDGTKIDAYRDNALIGTINDSVGIVAAEFFWRGFNTPGYTWDGAFVAGAAYNVALTAAQRTALCNEMAAL